MFRNLQLRFSIPSSPNYSALPTSSPPLKSPYHTPPQSSYRQTRPSPFLRRPSLFFIATFFILTCFFLSALLHSHHATLNQLEAQLDEIYANARGGIGNLTLPPWEEGWEDLKGQLGHELEVGKDFLGVGKAKERELACKDWDPEKKEVNDPEGCIKARQYRQVQRVLEREIKGEHGHWHFTPDANIATLQNLTLCFLPNDHPQHIECPDRPLIINGYWWSALTLKGGTSGESIWQESVLKQLDMLGIRTLFVGEYLNWITVAEMMPDVYRFIWAPDIEVVSCITDPRCIAKEHYTPPINAEDLSVDVPDEERGVIPLWRLQVVDYWGAMPKEISNNDHYWNLTENGEWSYHPLGSQWIQVPWDMPRHVHVPYSIEDHCLKLPYKTHEERNNSLLILAKKSSYFHLSHTTPLEFLEDLANTSDFDVLSTAKIDDDHELPAKMIMLGVQERDDYERLVGDVKVMLGIGFPPISPSVYTALCQGTPLVLPHRKEGLGFDGWSKFAGTFQHGPAMALGPPYVYSYHFQNYTQMVESIEQAMNNPIERYIPKDMEFSYALSHTKAFIDRDLRNMFRKVLRKTDGKIPRMQKGLRERCYELERCKEMLKDGRRPRTPAFWSREEMED